MIRKTEQEWLELIEKTNAVGRYQPTWASLSQLRVPQWFTQEHLGIFIHWGGYSVAANTDEWYPRRMYMQGTPAYEHHLKTYGAHKNFGYKDILRQFKAEKFDAKAWITLLREAGAGYVFPVAEHHDGFQMYESALSHWNAAEVGPMRDVLGELREEAERQGLHFCTSSHRVEHWWFMCHGRDFDSDIHEPLKKGDLYWPSMPEPEDFQDLNSPNAPNEEFMNDWLARTAELIVNYRPQLIYFDWWVQHMAVRPYLKKIAAFYYNCGEQWGLPVAICYKHDAMQPGCGIADVERGGYAEPKPFPWQTDTSVARNSWGYTENLDYKPTSEILVTLVDTVSKNGNLLLNIGPKGDGSIAEGDVKILTEMAAWMRVNGEAVRGAKPWRISAEGPNAVPHGEFSDQQAKEYTAQDIRFTTNHGKIFGTALRCPPDGRLCLKAFAKAHDAEFGGVVTGARVLGYAGKTEWHVDERGLHVYAPGMDSPWPVVVEIEAE